MVALVSGLSSVVSSENKMVPSVLIVAGSLLFAVFVRRQMCLKEPMLKITVLRSPRFAVAVAIAMASQIATIGLSFVMPLYVQNVLGQSATATGMTMLPGALLGAFAGLFSGKMFDKVGPRPIVLVGGGLALVGAVGMCFFAPDTSMVVVTTYYSLFFFGLMAVGTPLNTWGINSLDNSLIQHSNAVSNTFNQIAASAGIALVASLTAMPQALFPDLSASQAAFLGNHFAFMGVACAFAVAYMVMVAFVRNGFGARSADL